MQITENQVFVTNRYKLSKSHRRVISLFGNYVYYSNGGDSTRACQVRTFIRWVKERQASVVINEKN